MNIKLRYLFNDDNYDTDKLLTLRYNFMASIYRS